MSYAILHFMTRTLLAGSVFAVLVSVFAVAVTNAHEGDATRPLAVVAGSIHESSGSRVAASTARASQGEAGAITATRRTAGEAPAPLVMIDPGHGGTNTGAPGFAPGFYEKELTLRVARLLGHRLEKQGYRVILTRNRDVYLTLRERVRYANQLGADLFISVHANATETHAQRGYETFILTPRAMDVDTRALRADDGARRGKLDAQTSLMLDDLERGVAQPMAADLAAAIQDELRATRGPDGDRGVRQDAMHVLLGATMPAVLVEMGFVDHPIEGRELRDPEVQEQISRALARAIAATLPAR